MEWRAEHQKGHSNVHKRGHDNFFKLPQPHIYSCNIGRGEIKVGSTWDLTEERIGVLAKGSSHRRVQAGLAVPSRQLRPRVVATLVVIVLDIQVDQLGEVDAERAARIVDVLAIKCLQVHKS